MAHSKKMAELYGIDRSVVTKHLKNIFKTNELKEESVCAFFTHTAEDGKNYKTSFYSLEAIIAVGYRVNSLKGTQFRQWVSDKLKEYLIKDFVLDDEKFKNFCDNFTYSQYRHCEILQTKI